MVSQVCPDQERLAGFVQGLLTHQESHELEHHLQRCNACGDTVRELHASDTVLKYVRTLDIDDKLEDHDEPKIASLLDELRELPSEKNSSRSEASSNGTDVNLRVDEVLRLASPSVADDELGRIAHYRLLSLLGVGGMGVVFQAEDTKLQRLVALKVLQPSLGKLARDRFVREARAAAAIQHDNVITIYDVGLEGPLAYLAMQSLEGETLEHRLQREGTLPPEEVRRIAAEVADGLEAAHAKKLVHRDIKPANVWLEANRGRAQILDFGLARVSDADSELTETGMIAGTPAYMSPEQAQGRAVDARTDLFSLGSMMYRMMTGRVPFEGGNALATIRSIQSDQPTNIREVATDVPEDMLQTVGSLMAKERRDRVASASELADALRTRRPAKVAQQEPEKQSSSAKQATPGNFGRSGAAVAATILLAMAGWYAAPMIYRVATNQGVFEIDTQDPDVQVEVMQGGDQIEILDRQKNRITIAAGKYELQLKDKASHAIVTPETVTLSRNDIAVVRVKKVTQPEMETGPQEQSAEETKVARREDVDQNQVETTPPRQVVETLLSDSKPALALQVEKARVPFDYGTLKPNKDLEELHGIPGLAAVLSERPSSIWGLPLRLALTPDESHVYLVSSNGYVVKHDTNTLALVSRFQAHEQRCLDVVVMDEGRKLVTICIDGTARLWDITGSQPRKLHELLLVGPDAESQWLGMEVATNGLIVIRSWENIHLVHIDKERLTEETLPKRSKKSPWEFALSPDGKWLVTCEKSNEFETGRVGRRSYSYYDADLVLWNLTGEAPNVSDEYECKDMSSLVLHKNSSGEYLLEADDSTLRA